MDTKTRLEDLSVFGGRPAFREKVHVGRPNIGNCERLFERISGALDRRWLTNDGPLVREFEQRVADFLGVKHCLAVCNATIALEIAVRAAGLTGKVIIPSFTFIATAHSLQWQGISPVFCDVDPLTHNLDPRRVEEAITPDTTGILGVHLWGRPCDITALAGIAEEHRLKLLFDAAHAFGCSYRRQMLGAFGTAEVFSFHATKFFNTLEGGAIATNDDLMAEKIRLMRNFGFSGYDCVTSIGTNGKMNEVSAAMGLTGLENIAEFVATNRRNYQQYRREAERIPGIRLVTYDEAERCNYQYIVLEIDETVTNISRDQLLDVLWAENVLARRYFYPGCHRMEPYRSSNLATDLSLPVTEALAQRVLVLPTGTSVGADEISHICHIIRFAIANGKEIATRLHAAHQR